MLDVVRLREPGTAAGEAAPAIADLERPGDLSS
jgi:hypothetical protein